MKRNSIVSAVFSAAMISMALFAVASISSCKGGNDTESPIAKTVNGRVMGENRNGVAIFRGIPYGAPCEGEARWQSPKPAESWEGVRDCTENGPIAIQMGASISTDSVGLGAVFNGGHPELFKCQQEVQSENCLVLDVVTPGVDKSARPVVVYIHGGGFATGSGSLVLGSDNFAKEEDIVVVGINHRLNVFGYLYLGGLDPEYSTSGSAGIQDLVLALQWVRDNIAAFGGDPSNVTIMGESGGAMKICTLLTMPSAKGLFNKAIIESGASAADYYSPAAAEPVTEQLLANLGLTKENWKDIFTIDSQKILEASQGLNMSPVADGNVVPYVEQGEWAPKISKNIPVLVGASADEMAVFMPVDEFAKSVTWDNIAQKLTEIFSNGSVAMDIQSANDMVAAYKAVDRKNDDAWHTYIKIISCNGMLGNGANSLAMARCEAGFAPVYQYFVEFDSQHPFATDLRCAWHTADLPLQFRIVLNPECEELSKTFAHAWGAFIRTGNPSTDELKWPAFDMKDRQIMDFDDTVKVMRDPLEMVR